MLKAITLYEPWASLMAIGAKRNETRPRRINHRGDIAIHAAKKSPGLNEDVRQSALQAFTSHGLKPPDNAGCIVAVVDLWDVQPSEYFHLEGSEYAQGLARQRTGEYALEPNLFEVSKHEWNLGNYSGGRFIYRTHTLRRLAQPVPCRGGQATGWTVPPEVEALVRQQLPKMLHLQCCSCGEPAPAFEQWSNRDDGYGICANCFSKWVAKDGLESAIQCCGHPGVHHSI